MLGALAVGLPLCALTLLIGTATWWRLRRVEKSYAREAMAGAACVTASATTQAVVAELAPEAVELSDLSSLQSLPPPQQLLQPPAAGDLSSRWSCGSSSELLQLPFPRAERAQVEPVAAVRSVECFVEKASLGVKV